MGLPDFFSETHEKLIIGFNYRFQLSDCVKCHEHGCLEVGLPCENPGYPITNYYCPLHGVQRGYCETCGEFDGDMGREGRTQCRSCIQDNPKPLGDPSDFNDYGVGNPDEPNSPSNQ